MVKHLISEMGENDVYSAVAAAMKAHEDLAAEFIASTEARFRSASWPERRFAALVDRLPQRAQRAIYRATGRVVSTMTLPSGECLSIFRRPAYGYFTPSELDYA